MRISYTNGFDLFTANIGAVALRAYRQLSGPTLDEKFHSPVIRLFFLKSKKTGWNLSPLPVVMETFTANAMFITRRCACAVLLIDLCPRTLVLFFHPVTSYANGCFKQTNH